MLTDLDQTWAVSIPCVWILVEANLVVICGCLPIVRKFARHVAPKLFADSSSSPSSGNKNSRGYAGRKPTFDFQTIGARRGAMAGARRASSRRRRRWSSTGRALRAYGTGSRGRGGSRGMADPSVT